MKLHVRWWMWLTLGTGILLLTGGIVYANSTFSWHLTDRPQYSEEEVDAIVKQYYIQYDFRSLDVIDTNISECAYAGNGIWQGILTFFIRDDTWDYWTRELSWKYFEKSGTVSCELNETNTALPGEVITTPITATNLPTTASRNPFADWTPAPKNTLPPNTVEAFVTRVIDGDTIEVRMNDKNYIVRYIGIDTPEIGNANTLPESFGIEASIKNKDLVWLNTVLLEKDVSETDKYGRLLRYVYVGDLFINSELVRQSYAQVATYPPDVKYLDLFLKLQREAEEANLGLWGIK